MERRIDDWSEEVNLARAPQRALRARRLAVAIAVLLAALVQQAVAGERQQLVLCEKVKRNGESAGVVFRTAEQGCQGKETQMVTAAIPGVVNPDTLIPPRQSLSCITGLIAQRTSAYIPVLCPDGAEMTGGGMTLSVDDRLQGEHFEAVEFFDAFAGFTDGIVCDAGVGTEADFTCYAVCCQLFD